MNEPATEAIRAPETPPADVPAQTPANSPTVDFDAIRMEDMPTSIRVCEQNIQLNGWLLGGMLISAKKRLPHGAFMDWLKTHTDLSQTTANNLMSLHNGVLQTPFLAEMKQSAAVMLLALSPAQREKYAAEHDVQAMSVRQLSEDVERLKREAAESREALANAQEANQQNLERIATEAERAIATKAQEAANAQRAASNANGLYEQLSEQYAEAQERIATLEQSLNDVPVTITTVEVERLVEVLPPDYEQLQADLREANESAERMEADLRKARTDLLRESTQGKLFTLFYGRTAGIELVAAAMGTDRRRVERLRDNVVYRAAMYALDERLYRMSEEKGERGEACETAGRAMHHVSQ